MLLLMTMVMVATTPPKEDNNLLLDLPIVENNTIVEIRASQLRIMVGEGWIYIDLNTGNVTYENCTLSSGSRGFWDAVGLMMPLAREDLITATLKAEDLSNMEVRVTKALELATKIIRSPDEIIYQTLEYKSMARRLREQADHLEEIAASAEYIEDTLTVWNKYRTLKRLRKERQDSSGDPTAREIRRKQDLEDMVEEMQKILTKE